MSRLAQEAAQQILNEHNCVRSRYNSASLQWDWDLAADAQVHADRCGKQPDEQRDEPLQGVLCGNEDSAGEPQQHQPEIFV